jgi:hypothetical protein
MQLFGDLPGGQSIAALLYQKAEYLQAAVLGES